MKVPAAIQSGAGDLEPSAGGVAGMLEQFVPLFLIFAVVGGGLGALLLGRVLTSKKSLPSKREVFRRGSMEGSEGEGRLEARYFVVAILFAIFSAGIFFLWPWALLYREMSAEGYGAGMIAALLVFMSIMGVGLTCAWRGGALGWERSSR